MRRPVSARSTAPAPARIREAMVDLVVERGFGDATVEAAIELADVEPAEFLRHFEGKQDCCMQIYRGYIAEFNRQVFGAIDETDPWRDRLRAAAYASARFFRDHPREVRFSVLGLLEAGEMIQVERERHLQMMVDLVDSARQELDDPESMSRGVAESVVGSIFGFLLKGAGGEGEPRSAERLVPELMYIAVRPYFGHAEAMKELGIPPPPDPDRHG